MATISVLVPVFQAEKYLPQCLESLACQTYHDLEIVVIDDGSTDRSGSVCETYKVKNSHFRVLHKKNSGVVSSLHAGLEISTGKYIGFVDADDWIDTDYYGHLLGKMEELQADIVQAERIEVSEIAQPLLQEKTVLYNTEEEKSSLMKSFYTQYLLAPEKRLVTFARWDKLYKRDLVMKNIRYWDPSLYLAEDTVFNAAILPDSSRFAILADTPKYHYRILSNSNSHKFDLNEMNRISDLRNTLLRIADAKGTDPSLVDLYIAHAVYCRSYAAALQEDLGKADYKNYVRNLVKAVRPDILSKYASSRGSLPVSLSCFLLRNGNAGFFRRLSLMNERLQKKKTVQ